MTIFANQDDFVRKASRVLEFKVEYPTLNAGNLPHLAKTLQAITLNLENHITSINRVVEVEGITYLLQKIDVHSYDDMYVTGVVTVGLDVRTVTRKIRNDSVVYLQDREHSLSFLTNLLLAYQLSVNNLSDKYLEALSIATTMGPAKTFKEVDATVTDIISFYKHDKDGIDFSQIGEDNAYTPVEHGTVIPQSNWQAIPHDQPDGSTTFTEEK